MAKYLQQLREQKAKDEPFRKLVKILSEIYAGKSYGETLKFGNETEAHKNMRPKFLPNFFRKAIQDLSYLYAVDPIRKSTNYDFWEANVWSKDFDLKMLEADSLARIAGTSLIIVSQDGSVYVIPRERFTAYGETAEAVAVLIEWDSKTQLYIDEFEYVFLSENNELSQPNDYGMLPCVLIKNTFSSSSVYGDNLGGQDILTNIATLNLQFCELTYVSMLQRGQPVIVCDGEAKNIVIGPDTPIHLQNGSFTFANNGADIEKMRVSLQTNLDALAISLGLPKRSFNVRSSLDQISADAIYASQLELSQDRQIRQKLFKSYERKIYTIIAADKNVDIPTVNFVDFVKPTSPSETLAKAAFEVTQGLVDTETLARNLNPSVSQPELTEILVKAKSEVTEKARKKAIIAGRENSDSVRNEE